MTDVNNSHKDDFRFHSKTSKQEAIETTDLAERSYRIKRFISRESSCLIAASLLSLLSLQLMTIILTWNFGSLYFKKL